jgi:hypothetical protein
LLAWWADEDLERTVATEFDGLTGPVDNIHRYFVAQVRHWIDLRRGDLDDSLLQGSIMENLVRDTPFAWGRWASMMHAVNRAYLSGALRDALVLNDAQFKFSHDSGQTDALNLWAVLDLPISRDLGLLEERLQMLRDSMTYVTQSASMRWASAALALTLCEAGDTQAAAEMLKDEQRTHFELADAHTPLSDEYAYLVSEVAATIGDTESAAILYELMLPRADGTVSNGTMCHGSMGRPLGRLATTLGAFDDAETHLHNALERNRMLKAPLHLARTWADQATLSVRRDGSRSLDHARELVARAIETAKQHDATGVEQYAAGVLA